MTYNEALTCKSSGMSRDTILAQLAAVHAMELRTTEALLARAYGEPQPQPVARPAYPSEMICAPRVAYDYNNSSDQLLSI